MNEVIKDTQQHDLPAVHHHLSDITTKVNGAQLIVQAEFLKTQFQSKMMIVLTRC